MGAEGDGWGQLLELQLYESGLKFSLIHLRRMQNILIMEYEDEG